MNRSSKLLLAISFTTMSTLAFSQEQPKMVWERKVHEFNQVSPKDSLVETTFFFKVQGKNPLVIYDIPISCSCTAVDWVKHPVKPYERGYVKIVFYPKGKKGHFDKRFIVKSNAQKSVDLLRIKGCVK